MKELIQKGLKFISKNSPTILTAFGVAGLGATCFMVHKGTKKSIKQIEEVCEDLNIDEEELPFKDKAKICWKNYVPAAAMGITTSACIVGANTVSTKRNAALASAYILAKDAVNEYQEKVVETIGEKKAQKIQNSIVQDKVNETYAQGRNNIIDTHDGTTLCFDKLSGRYFYSNMEKIRSVVNDLNELLLKSTWVALNELYAALNLPFIRIGDDLGWDLNEDGLINLHIDSCLAEDGTPCLTIDPVVRPEPRYYGGGEF